jgi:hypothetical protein
MSFLSDPISVSTLSARNALGTLWGLCHFATDLKVLQPEKSFSTTPWEVTRMV